MGRKIQVPSSWFGVDFAQDCPDLVNEVWILNLLGVEPETKTTRRRLVMTCEKLDNLFYFCDKKDFPSTIMPYLLVDDPNQNAVTRLTVDEKVFRLNPHPDTSSVPLLLAVFLRRLHTCFKVPLIMIFTCHQLTRLCVCR